MQARARHNEEEPKLRESTPSKRNERVPLRSLLVVAVAVAMLAAACGTGDTSDESTDTTAAATETTAAGSDTTAGSDDTATDGEGMFPDDGTSATLTWSTWNWGANYEEMLGGFMEEYAALDPRVEGFEVDVRPYSEYHSSLNVAMAAGRAPEVGWIHGSVLDAYIDAGRLVDLRPVIEEYFPDYDLDDYNEDALANLSRGDALYAIPAGDQVYSMVYNSDLFEAAGIDTPLEMIEAGTWNWENLQTAAKQLVDSGAARFGFDMGSTQLYNIGWHQLAEFYAAFGGSVWSDDKTQCTINEPEAVEATQLLWDMVFVDESMAGPGVDVDFASGDIGMSITRNNQAPGWNDAGFGWDIVRMPDGPEGFVPGHTANAVVAFVDSPNPELGAIFAAFTGTVENAREFLAISPIPRNSILEDVEAIRTSDSILTPEQMDQAVLPALTAEDWIPGFGHPNFDEVHSQSMPIFDEVWLPGADVQGVLDDVCESIQPLLGG